MTGHPEHPGTGFTIRGEPTNLLDYEEIGKALGVKSIRKINPFRINETMQVLKEEMDKDEQLSLVLCVDSPCVLLRREKRQFEHSLYEIDADKCWGIKVCLSISCLAVSWCEHGGKTIDGHKRKGIVYINPDQCVGGQGAILSSNILGEAFLNAGYDVKNAEVNGMARRGGDVTTHFRRGKKVYSPLIKQGDADFLITFGGVPIHQLGET